MLVGCTGLFPLASQAQPAVSWNRALDQPAGWYGSEEAIRIAGNLLVYQHERGGWPKNMDMASPLDEAAVQQIRRGQTESGNSLSEPTIDNSATYTQMRFLARVFEQTGDARLQEGFLRGFDYLLEAQYENGGWPQFYPLRGGYYDRITFNDGAMIGVMRLLRDAAAGSQPFAFVDAGRRAAAEKAIERGIEVILKTQIREEGRLMAWCAQHDEKTLEPAWARTYEPPSYGTAATAGIVRFLMSIESPSAEVVAAIEAGMDWLRSVEIRGLRYESIIDEKGAEDRRVVPDAGAGPLWARFYELGTHRPIFLGRDSVVRYALAEIEQERRSGYAYYGTWPAELLAQEYPAWKGR